MQLDDKPDKIVLPFAETGGKNTIPVASQIGVKPGAASFADGFPPLTRTPLAAGGVPPSGLDMNGILNQISGISKWMSSGAGFTYDSAFANDPNVNGYPMGARVARSDGAGYWLNTVDNNTSNPEAAGADAAGWAPDTTNGVAAVAMSSANVTLTPMQWGCPIIALSGTLTANVNLIFPEISGQWIVNNSCTGVFGVTCKTSASGASVTINTGYSMSVWSDGTNIYTAKAEADLSQYKIKIDENGYQYLPTGLIIQWGVGSPIVAQTSMDINLNVFYPTAHLMTLCGNSFSSASNVIGVLGVQYVDRTKFTVHNSGNLNQANVPWISVGY